MGKNKYPDDTRIIGFYLINEKIENKVVPTIRQAVILPDRKRRLDRYPVVEYRSFRNNPRELEDFVIRLNHQIPEEKRARESVEIKHAFISTEMLDEYLAYLVVQIPTQSIAKTEWHYCKTYFLNYFIGNLNLPSPLDWHRKQTEWAHSLLGRDSKLWLKPMSGKLIKDVIISANRFMRWLHIKRPNEVPPLVFNPITRAVYKELKARRRLSGEAREPRYITDSDWLTIEKSLPDSLRPFILIAYSYGLRRSEILGLKLEDVRKSHLSIERQLSSFSTTSGPKYGPLKGREPRLVPHWQSTPAQAYRLIGDGHRFLCNPTSFGKLFSHFMNTLEMNYTLHDLRHTWVTKMIQVHSPEEVRRAAGHKDLTTTMKYIHKGERQTGDEVYQPDEAS